MNVGERLHDHPQLLREVLDATRLIVAVVGMDGRVLDVNRAFEDVTGLGADACRRPLWEHAARPEERALLREAFSAPAPGPFPPGFLFHLSSKDGPRVVDWSTRLVGQDAGQPTLLLVGVDLSERLAAEARLIESAARQRLVMERIPAVVWTTDADLRFTTSTGGGLERLGLGPDQVALVGTSLFQYFHTSDSGNVVIDAHLRALRGEKVPFDVTWLGRQFQARTEPLVDDDGKTVGCLGVALDVTERAEAERSLRRSEARLRRLIDSNVIGIVVWSREGTVLDANDAFLNLLGFSRDDLAAGAISWRGITPPEYRALDEEALAQLETVGTCVPFEKEYVAKDGARVPVLIGGATFDERGSGALATGVAFVLDLRQQVQMRRERDALLVAEREARRESERANARLRLVAEVSKRLAGLLRIEDILSALAHVVVPDLADWSYVIHRGWEGGHRLFASAHRDASKVTLLHRLDDCVFDRAAPDGGPRVFRTGEVAVYSDISDEQISAAAPCWPLVGTRDPGHLRVIQELGMRSLLCVPIAGRKGVDAVLMLVASSDPRRYRGEDVVLAQEIAGRVAASLENGRLFAEALEGVRVRDEFLSVAAHELRTPITSLSLHLQRLARGLDGGKLQADAASQGVDGARRQTQRLSALVDNLLDVSQLAAGQLPIVQQEVDLVDLVRRSVGATSTDLQRAGCRVDLVSPPSLVGRADPARMAQVLTHLLTNAAKFGAGRPVEVTVEATPRCALISVRDHGIGISPDDHARIFGRFERAVSPRHFGGLGLGLYLSAEILRAHGGSLRVESAPGQGACFIVELPAAA